MNTQSRSSESMKKVLVIAYYFPPMGLSGVQRTAKFVKYLPQYNWQATVLTVIPRYFAKDVTLLREIENLGTEIIRTKTLDPTRLFRSEGEIRLPPEWARKFFNRLGQVFFIPDNKIGWRWKAIEAATQLIKREKIHVIFATAPPFTEFLIGAHLKSKFGIPLVFDYRDPWVDNPQNFYATPFHRALHVYLEKKSLRAANKIVTINRRIKEELLKRYPILSYEDVLIVPHGFDPEDFRIDGRVQLPVTDKMRITYSGTFMDDRNPTYFLQALSRVFREKPNLRGRIEACFVGMFRDENMKIVRKLGLEKDVKVVGYVDHSECVKYLLASDVLWLMLGKKKGMDMVSTGKLHEYFGARKFILGCVPDGIAKTTILDSGGGIVVEPDKPDEIARAIVSLYGRYERRELKPPSPEFVDRFDRSKLAGDLAKVFEFVMERKVPNGR
ncbi:MAG: glycosyltransferase family 4 protein [Bacteroidota bacterium]